MLLENKTAVVLNPANKRSIAWAIAKEMDAQGAKLVLGYQNDRTKGNVEKLAEELSKPPLALIPCDVTNDEDIANAAASTKEVAGTVDVLVHSLAFAPKECLEKPFIETERDAFKLALEISAFSLPALCRAFAPILNDGASIMAMSYYGAEKVVPNYNVMGVAKAALEASVRYLAYDLGPRQIRVNAISAGPLNTLAARGVSGFVDMMDMYKDRAPMKRGITAEEVAGTAIYLASHLASGVTGETIYVDTGYNIMGL